MPDAIETDSADTLSEALSDKWDEMEAEDPAVETPVDDVQDDAGEVSEDEVTDDTEVEEEAADDETAEPTDEESDEETEGLVAPEHWRSEDKEMFEGLDDSAKEFINRRYASMEKDYHQKTQGIASEKKYNDSVKAMLDPFREQMNLAGVDDMSAIQRLTAAQSFLMRDPKGAIQHLAKEYGVDLDEIDYEAEEVDPQIKALQDEVAQLKSGVQTRTVESVNNEIAQFKDAKDSSGAVLHPHFDDVYDDMVTLVKSGVASDLDGAYQKAIWSNETVRVKLLESKLSAEKKRIAKANSDKTAKAKRMARTNIRSSGVPKTEDPSELSLEQELEKNYDAL